MLTDAKGRHSRIAESSERAIDRIWFSRAAFIAMSSLDLLIALPRTSVIPSVFTIFMNPFGCAIAILFAAIVSACGCILLGSAWPRVERVFLTASITTLILITATSLM